MKNKNEEIKRINLKIISKIKENSSNSEYEEIKLSFSLGDETKEWIVLSTSENSENYELIIQEFIDYFVLSKDEYKEIKFKIEEQELKKMKGSAVKRSIEKIVEIFNDNFKEIYDYWKENKVDIEEDEE